MSLFHVTIDTGDGYYGHTETWTVELSPNEKTTFRRWLDDLVATGSIESFKLSALSAANTLATVKPKVQAWIKANPKGRNYGGPGSRG